MYAICVALESKPKPTINSMADRMEYRSSRSSLSLIYCWQIKISLLSNLSVEKAEDSGNDGSLKGLDYDLQIANHEEPGLTALKRIEVNDVKRVLNAEDGQQYDGRPEARLEVVGRCSQLCHQHPNHIRQQDCVDLRSTWD